MKKSLFIITCIIIMGGCTKHDVAKGIISAPCALLPFGTSEACHLGVNELYDLADDPQELENIAAQEPGIVDRLLTSLAN